MFVCDADLDCIDGSDEQHCDPMVVKNASEHSHINTLGHKCEYPSRYCDNNTKCITVDMLCDNRQDCKDGSDEGQRCLEMLCDHSHVCSHECHNAPEGLICTCPPSLHLQADKRNCLPTHPCSAWGVCSQKCISKGHRYQCTCFPGFALEDDNFTCKSTDNATAYVIFSNRHELRGVDLHSFHVKSFIASLKNTIALDFYHEDNVDMASIAV